MTPAFALVAMVLLSILSVGCLMKEEPFPTVTDTIATATAMTDTWTMTDATATATDTIATGTAMTDTWTMTDTTATAVVVLPPRYPSFPWPPPPASASINISQRVIPQTAGGGARMRDVDRRLRAALDRCGYVEKKYFTVPEGFAVVTRLERISADGTPLSPGRWSLETGPMHSFDLGEYLRRLFTANPGHFRIIVFITTSKPFTESGAPIDAATAQRWFHEGLNRLPAELGARLVSEQDETTALIYEFERLEGKDPAFVSQSVIGAVAHLQRSGLDGALGE
jgi:hypothetical protein